MAGSLGYQGCILSMEGHNVWMLRGKGTKNRENDLCRAKTILFLGVSANAHGPSSTPGGSGFRH